MTNHDDRAAFRSHLWNDPSGGAATVDRVDEFGGAGTLEQVARRANLYGVEHVAARRRRRQHEHLDLGERQHDGGRRVGTVAVGQIHVHEDQVGARRASAIDGLAHGPGGGDDVVAARDEVAFDGVTPHRMIVDDHDAGLGLTGRVIHDDIVADAKIAGHRGAAALHCCGG